MSKRDACQGCGNYEHKKWPHGTHKCDTCIALALEESQGAQARQRRTCLGCDSFPWLATQYCKWCEQQRSSKNGTSLARKRFTMANAHVDQERYIFVILSAIVICFVNTHTCVVASRLKAAAKKLAGGAAVKLGKQKFKPAATKYLSVTACEFNDDGVLMRSTDKPLSTALAVEPNASFDAILEAATQCFYTRSDLLFGSETFSLFAIKDAQKKTKKHTLGFVNELLREETVPNGAPDLIELFRQKGTTWSLGLVAQGERGRPPLSPSISLCARV